MLLEERGSAGGAAAQLGAQVLSRLAAADQERQVLQEIGEAESRARREMRRWKREKAKAKQAKVGCATPRGREACDRRARADRPTAPPPVLPADAPPAAPTPALPAPAAAAPAAAALPRR